MSKVHIIWTYDFHNLFIYIIIYYTGDGGFQQICRQYNTMCV